MEEAPQSVPGVRGATDRALAAAIEIYTRWQAEHELTPLDRCVDSEFRARRYLNAGERRWIAEVLYSSVRLLRRQTFLLEILALPDTPENRIRLRAAETGAVSFRQSPPLVTPEALQDALDALPGSDTPQEFLRTTLSFPDDMAAELEALLGEEATAAAEAFNQQAPITLRVNTLRTTREKVEAALEGATLTRFSPWGLYLPGRVHLPSLPGFREGWFEMQEEASQLAVLASGASPGMTVVDVGAGAGGKTLALAAMMKNKGRIFALDTSEARLNELQKRARRAGVSIAHPVLISASSEGEWLPSASLNALRQKLGDAGANVVFVDAPCTGSGVMRRSPDAKWRTIERKAVARVQLNLLTQAASLVGIRGRLFYITCAFERWQNEEIVAAFLNKKTEAAFSLDNAASRLAAFNEIAGTDGSSRLSPGDARFLRTWPHRHGLDAFFFASLARNAL